jgi:acyl-[acyl-carrier-protein]-phospholipid O-acyltransferase / long-chain-fatty-acid--[acyl-carrier-protein] ligase
VIFPEGKLTRTGSLMKIYDGPGVIADQADAAIVPMRIEGAQYTPFSRLKGKVRLHWFPKVRITVLPARRFKVPLGLSARERRHFIGTALYDLMSNMVFETADRNRTLFQALIDAGDIHGVNAPIVEDVTRKPLTYRRLISLSLMLGRALSEGTNQGECVGVLMPNAASTAAAFMALQAFGRVPAMLNFTTGVDNVIAGCKATSIRTIITSRTFIKQSKLGEMIEKLSREFGIVWLEDVKSGLRLVDKLYGVLLSPWAGAIHRHLKIGPQSPAVVLFTSGSEGTPKGVALRHSNLLANCLQLSACIDFNAGDTVFNALPMFHSFGLTGGFVMPLVSGVRTFLYPSPLHYRIVPELVYDTNATLFFGTNTFLAGYARHANAYDFYSVRYIFAGAERVEERTRQIFAEKFGLRILEGYGVTEAAPVIACNTPMHYRAGTVGRLMPGIEARIDPVEGISEGGRLFVRGPNVMLGYFMTKSPGTIQSHEDGWHDTGDIVTIDKDGFIRIAGRAKRFAKIAGEMVPLTRIESEVATIWPDSHHAVVAIPDEQKGERLVLVTSDPAVNREKLLTRFRECGLGEILVPREIVKVAALPLLGSGKTDYVGVQKLANDQRTDEADETV